MGNVLGTWRCVREQDTAHINVMLVANRILELTICNLHLLPVLCQLAWAFSSSNQPTREVWSVEVMYEQCAWYVEVCV